MLILKKKFINIFLIVLIASQLLWLLLAPGSFKKAWSQNPLIAEIIRQHNLALEKGKIMTISYYFPHFPYFADIVSGIQKPDPQLMDGYHFGKPYIFREYYQKAADFFPNNDSIHVLLGFTQYYQKDIHKAAENYQKALELNPYFFWTYYNLGVIYFQQKEYVRSALVLTRSLLLEEEITLKTIGRTALYRQIWKSLANPPEILLSNLEQGKQDAQLLLAACYLKAKTYDQAMHILESINNPTRWHQNLKEALRTRALNHEVLGDPLEEELLDQIPVRLF